MLFHDIAGLDMNLKEWKQFCRKSWENEYDSLQMEKVGILSQIVIKTFILNALQKRNLFD